MWFEDQGCYRHKELHALGVRHGVTTRALGSMKDPEARARALEAARASLPLFRTARQVHGTRVVRWEEAGAERPPEADALVTDRPDSGVGVYVADCMPLFIWEKSGAVVGVAHMGWRGTAAGLGRSVVEALIMDYGVDPRDLRAAFGPHIRACCYPVGPEVARQFPSQAVEPGRDGKSLLHMATAGALHLQEAGLSAKHIDQGAECTGCKPDAFFSFRREKADNRMLAFAVHG